MRTLIDIPDAQIADLTALCALRKVSRAEIVRQAIAAYLDKNQPSQTDAFGILKHQGMDGLRYQKQVREEW